MQKLVSIVAGAIGGSVVGFLLAWSLDAASTRSAMILCACFGVAGAIASLVLSPEFLGRAYEFILRMLNPP